MGVGVILRETLFPRPFFVSSKYLPPIVGNLSMIPFNKYGLGLLDPVMPSNEKSKFATCKHRVYSIPGGVGEFSNADHLLVLSE